MNRRRLPMAVALSVLLAACSDRPTDVAPSIGIPQDLLQPALSVLDGTHEGGNEHFFWLPPLGDSKKGFEGVADPTQQPAVEVCLRDDAAEDGCAEGEPLVARFTRTSGRNPDRIQVDDKDEYFVHWRMNDFPPQRDGQYRIRVVIQGTELGHADVVTMRQREIKAYNGDLIAISDNGAFKIAFRIEEGALCSQGALGCTTGTEVPGDGQPTVVQVPAQTVGGDQVVAAVVTVNDAVFEDANGTPIPDVVVSASVRIGPPSTDVLTDDTQEIPFFVEIKTFPSDVYIDPNGPGVEVVICQDESVLDARNIPEPLHQWLILYKVSAGTTKRLVSTYGAPECAGAAPVPAPGLMGMLKRGASTVFGILGPQPLVARRRLHGGLNTVVRRSTSDAEAFSIFGAALGPDAANTQAIFPAFGSVGAPVPITIQVKNALGENFLLGGDTPDVTVSSGPSAGAPVTVTDVGLGMYTASYTPLGIGQDVIDLVLIRNDGVGLGPIGGSPFTLDIRCFSPNALATVTVTLGATCGTPGEVPTFEIAMDVVQPGGTILANSGTHIVENLVVNKPVTIGEVGGAGAVVQNDTARQSFLVDGVTSGLVTIQNLDFVNNASGVNAGGERSASIRAKGTYDQVVVENSTFTNLPTSSNSGVRSDTTTVPGATMVVRNNTFTGGRTGVVATGVFNDPALVAPFVTVENNTFADHNSVGVQFQLAAQGNVANNDLARCGLYCIQYQNGSNGTISGNDVDDCGTVGCIRVFGGTVDVLNNVISDASPLPADPNAVAFHNAIRFSQAVGAVNGNTINGCGWGVCIQVAYGAVAEVRNNTITGNEADDTEAGIIGFGGTDDDPNSQNNLAPTLTAVTGNVITGVGSGSGGPGDPDYYAFKINGIMMRNATATEVSGNTITNAVQGINVFQNGSIASGVDNVVDGSLFAVNGYLNSSVSMTDNDFTNWVVAINDSDGTLSGSMQCNWWGSAAGPVGSVSASLVPAFYAPWAVGPVAGAATAACTGAVLDQQNLLDGSLGGQGIGRFSDINGAPDPAGTSYDLQDAQGFTVGITGTLGHIRVPIRNLNSATLGVTLEVVRVSGGVPDLGQVLGTATLPSSAFLSVDNGDPTTWPAFDLAGQAISVTAGEQLAFWVRTESTIAYLYNPEHGAAYLYPDGNGYRRNAALGPAWSTLSTTDFGFQTFVTPAASPAPPAPIAPMGAMGAMGAAPAMIARPIVIQGGGVPTPTTEEKPIVR